MDHIDVLIMDQQVSSVRERPKVLKKNNYTVDYNRRSAVRLSITDSTPAASQPKTPNPSAREESSDPKDDKPKEKPEKMPQCCGCTIL